MTTETGIISVYVTFPSSFNVEGLVADLVAEKLAACGNILPAVRSVYEWEGKIEHDTETAAILKTQADKLDALTRRIKSAHPYEVPCIVAWPVIGGLPDYLDWVRTQTR